MWCCGTGWDEEHDEDLVWTKNCDLAYDVVVQAEMKNLMKTWSELYVNFVRLSAMVTNTEPNIACEQLMSSVINVTDQIPAQVLYNCHGPSVCK